MTDSHKNAADSPSAGTPGGSPAAGGPSPEAWRNAAPLIVALIRKHRQARESA